MTDATFSTYLYNIKSKPYVLNNNFIESLPGDSYLNYGNITSCVLKKLMNTCYELMNAIPLNHLNINILNDSKQILDGKIKSDMLLFDTHYDNSLLYNMKSFAMFSIIYFYELPENINLELTIYTKIKHGTKMFGLIPCYKYKILENIKIHKNTLYLVPNFIYYKVNIINDSYKQNSGMIKFLWISSQLC